MDVRELISVLNRFDLDAEVVILDELPDHYECKSYVTLGVVDRRGSAGLPNSGCVHDGSMPNGLVRAAHLELRDPWE